MRFKLSFLFALIVSAVAAQDIHVKVDTTQSIPNIGANRRLHLDYCMGAGFITGPEQRGAGINWWSSSLSFSVRGKLKLWSWESLVADFGYRYDRYSIDQKQVKRLPVNPLTHQRERISVSNLSFSFCNRISLGKHGNVLGRFIDAGVYADWAFRATNVYLDQYYDSNSPAGRSRIKSKLSRLNYVERVNYGFMVRVGSDNASLFGMWRMNDLIKDSVDRNYPDLPKLIIGIQVSGLMSNGI
ncbi:MAG: hypothetical protein ACRC3B_00660 [Bacteroidia bacterium]